MQKKRKSFTEYMEGIENPELESAHIKVAGSPAEDVSSERSADSVVHDTGKIEDFMEKHGRNRVYTQIHTHPRNYVPDANYKPVNPSSHTIYVSQTKPGLEDIQTFLQGKSRYMVITQINPKTKEVSGHLVFGKMDSPNSDQQAHRDNALKMRDSSALEHFQERLENWENWEKEQGKIGNRADVTSEKILLRKKIEEYRNAKGYTAQISEGGYTARGIAEEFGFRYRFIPVPSKSKRTSNLETKAFAAASIIGIFGGLFFLSSNITGNVVGSLTNSTSNIVGAVLLVLGIIGSFFLVSRIKSSERK